MNQVFHVWNMIVLLIKLKFRKISLKIRNVENDFSFQIWLSCINKTLWSLSCYCGAKQKDPQKECRNWLFSRWNLVGQLCEVTHLKGRLIDTHVELDYTKLVRVLHPEYGASSRVQVLWWIESLDSCVAGSSKLRIWFVAAVWVWENVNYQVSL